MVLWESFGPRRTGSAERPRRVEARHRASGSHVFIFLRILVVIRFGLRCGFLFFHRLLDDLLLDERLRRDRLANHAARNRVPGGSSAWGDGRDRRRGLRRSGSLGGRAPPGPAARPPGGLADRCPAPPPAPAR